MRRLTSLFTVALCLSTACKSHESRTSERRVAHDFVEAVLRHDLDAMKALAADGFLENEDVLRDDAAWNFLLAEPAKCVRKGLDSGDAFAPLPREELERLEVRDEHSEVLALVHDCTEPGSDTFGGQIVIGKLKGSWQVLSLSSRVDITVPVKPHLEK